MKESADPKKLLYKLNDLREAHPRLKLLENSHSSLVGELLKVQKEAREFGEKHIATAALSIDKKMAEDHSYFAWDIVEKALDYRFFSYAIPEGFGGLGYSTTHFAVLMEELCSFCPGIANIFGAHTLGISPMMMAPDIRCYDRYLRLVTDGEKNGKPVIFALAITEPGAGSDVEDLEEMKTAKLCTWARKVEGGYILNGRKVFISNGSIADYIWVSASIDREHPETSTIACIVPRSVEGYSVGTIEKKMGQRACPAAEIILDDVFVPEEDIIRNGGDSSRLKTSVLGASRGPVAAIATGIARGAFQALLYYLNDYKVSGRYLFEEQRVQLILVDLMTKIQISRQLYLDAVMTCDLLGMPKLLSHFSMKSMKYIPEFFLRSKISHKMFSSNVLYNNVRKMADKAVSNEDLEFIAGLSSIAKYTASDLAVEVTSKAMDIMGTDGPIQEYGVEKFYRDAKLTQIYEGTNQINRISSYNNLLL